MDFRRSTLVLIISFFLLNVFLFFTYRDLKQQMAPAANNNINIIDQMRSDGISMVGLSNESSEAPLVQITPVVMELPNEEQENQNTTIDKGMITNILMTPIPIEVTSVINQDSFDHLTKFVQKSAFRGEDYQLFSYQLSNKIVLYQQSVKDIPIIDKKAQLMVNLNENNEAISYEQSYAGDAEILGEPRQLISSQVAVETLYLAGSIPARAVIEKPRLVYYETLTLSDLSIYSPAWYIELKIGDGGIITKKVDAIRGNIISTDVE